MLYKMHKHEHIIVYVYIHIYISFIREIINVGNNYRLKIYNDTCLEVMIT